MIDPYPRATTESGKNEPPRISVLMPAYNAERFIAAAMNSVLHQSVTDLELIVHLDAPTDRTADVVGDIAARDPRVRIIGTHENLGPSVGLNRAAAIARAPVLGRMDADDIALRDRFERQLAVLESDPRIAVVGCDAVHISLDDRPLGLSLAGPRSVEEFEAMRARGDVTLVVDSTATMRRDVFEAVGGYDPAMPIAQEVDLHSRMAAFGAVVSIPEPLLLYRLHPDSRVATRFFEGRAMHRFVEARNKALLAGTVPPTSFDEFVEAERSDPAPQRLLRSLADRGRYHYRTAGVRIAGHRHGAAMGHLLAGLALNPAFVTQRLWNRRLSAAARREMRAVEGDAPGRRQLAPAGTGVGV